MTFRDASEAIDRIANAGIKSPFTFWALLAVTCLGLIMALGSFWLLNIQMAASQDRYDRLFKVMEASAQSDAAREAQMVEELRTTRVLYSDNLRQVVDMLIKQAPTRIDEAMRAEYSTNVKNNTATLEKLETQQNEIISNLQLIRSRFEVKPGR